MTKNKALKAQARDLAAREGIAYAEALRQVLAEGPTRVVGADVYHALVDALRNDGWPVTEGGFKDNAWTLTAGPAVSIDVRPRDGDADGMLALEDLSPLTGGTSGPLEDAPDDVVELGVVFPNCAEEGFEAYLDPQLPGPRQARVVERFVAASRASAVSRVVNDVQCDYCRDAYPDGHLLEMTFGPDMSPRETLCPACAFEPEVLDGRHPGEFMELYDAMVRTQASAPAGWGAVAVFTAVAMKAGGFDLAAELELDPFSGLEPHWGDPAQVWVWLPPVKVRPACWKDLGPGATIGRLVSLLDRDDPDLVQRVLATREDPRDAEVTRMGRRPRTRFIEELWPAVVAYAVAFTTQEHEHPRRRSPWDHVRAGSLTGSWDRTSRTGDYAEAAGVDWYDADVAWTLELCVDVAGALFGQPAPSTM